jgi:transposase-like protein
MGRPPEGPGLADRLEGPEEAKKRLRAILETISGERTIEDAANSIGVRPARFHELRKEALEGALSALAPKPAGRPREVVDEVDPRVAELEEQIRQITIDIKAAKVREQIALTMPHLLDSTSVEISPIEVSKKRKSLVMEKIRRTHRRG